MTPIPKSALPIAEYIRENAPRPKELPRPRHGEGLRFGLFCPTGLLSEATDPTPGYRFEFLRPPKGFSQLAIESFYKWWDSQTDPQAAMDAIWPRSE